MIFSTKHLYRHHKLEIDSINVMCGDNTSLKRVDSMKILGITFEKHLDWTSYVNKIAKDCFSTIRILNRLKRFIPFKVRRDIAQTLILSKIDYGSTVIKRSRNICQTGCKRL